MHVLQVLLIGDNATPTTYGRMKIDKGQDLCPTLHYLTNSSELYVSYNRYLKLWNFSKSSTVLLQISRFPR